MSHSVTKKRENHRKVAEYSNTRAYSETGPQSTRNSHLDAAALGWLRYQPASELSRWYQKRFAQGNTRLRKVGIVALARKLLVALWKYVEGGEEPLGAVMVGWENKRGYKGVKARQKKASREGNAPRQKSLERTSTSKVL